MPRRRAACSSTGRRYRELDAPLRTIGALLDAGAVDDGRTAANHLLWLAHSNGIERARVGHVLDLVGLGDVADRRVGTFSLGMRQRLGIAAALLGDAHVLMFDEPTNGLDPDGIIWLRATMRRLAAEGRAVFVSSHLMSEVAQTADHVIVIGRGRIVADAPIDAIVAQHGLANVYVRAERQQDLSLQLVRHGAQMESCRRRRRQRARPGFGIDRGDRRRRRDCAQRADPAPAIARGRLLRTDPRPDTADLARRRHTRRLR